MKSPTPKVKWAEGVFLMESLICAVNFKNNC